MDYYDENDNSELMTEDDQDAVIYNDINFFYLDTQNVILLEQDDIRYEQTNLPIELQLSYRLLRNEFTIDENLERYLLSHPELIIPLTQQLSKKSDLLKLIYNINYSSNYTFYKIN